MPSEIRIYLDSAATAEENMAKDQALFQNLRWQQGAPAIRIYTWAQTAITVGYGTSMTDGAKFDQHWPMLKRPTGGGIVVHRPQGEITFAFVGYRERGRSITELYRKIHAPLAQAFNSLDVPAELLMDCPPDRCNQASNLACFDFPVLYDIMAGSKKIMGGGLRLGGTCFLYQGTLKWHNLTTSMAAEALQSSALFIEQWGIPIITNDLAGVKF